MIIIAILFCVIAWLYRIINLLSIISNGKLVDFFGYFNVAQQIMSRRVEGTTLLNTSYGPPFVYLPFLPWAALPFKLAEILFTLVNLTAFGFVFVKLWQKAGLKFDWRFWVLIGLSAFSFPLIYSLGMGNPIGLVTLGIYGLWIFKNYWLKLVLITQAILLKIFPGVVVLPLLICHSGNQFTNWSTRLRLPEQSSGGQVESRRNVLRRIIGIITILLIILLIHLIIFPSNIFSTYYQSFSKLFAQSFAETHVYNQSLIAVLGRWGIADNLRLIFLWIGLIIGLSYWSFKFIPKLRKQTDWKDVLTSAVTLLAIFLIIQPISWQYYFAILLPFILLKIGRGEWKYLPVLILTGIDGNKFGGIFINSQFWGTLLMVGINLFSSTSSDLLGGQKDKLINRLST